MAELLAPFHVETAYYDVQNITTRLPAAAKDFAALLQWADIVSCHCSFDGKNAAPLIGPQELKSMQRGSWLINVGRGGIVDEAALLGALREGHLAGAALDVFGKEPYTGPLADLEQVILTPHIGSYAQEARTEMELEAVENLLKGLRI